MTTLLEEKEFDIADALFAGDVTVDTDSDDELDEVDPEDLDDDLADDLGLDADLEEEE